MTPPKPLLIIAALITTLPQTFPNAWAGISVKNGNFYITYTDIYFDDDTLIARTYNSKTASSGIFGNGWSSDLEHTLTLTPDGNIQFTHNGGGKTETFTQAHSPDGVPTWVDAYGNAITRTPKAYQVQWKNGERHRFDLNGRLLRTANNNGETLKLQYRHGHITDIWLSSQHHLKAQFYSNGKLRRLSLATDTNTDTGTASHYRYSLNGDLIETTDAGNNRFKYEYDRQHNLTAIRYRDGSSRTLRYNRNNQLTHQDNEKGCQSRLAYGRDPEAPETHYWRYRWESCQGDIKQRYVAEYDQRGKRYGRGSSTRYWLVPADYHGQALKNVRYQQRQYNNRGMLIERNDNQRGDMPALKFTDPLH